MGFEDSMDTPKLSSRIPDFLVGKISRPQWDVVCEKVNNNIGRVSYRTYCCIPFSAILILCGILFVSIPNTIRNGNKQGISGGWFALLIIFGSVWGGMWFQYKMAVALKKALEDLNQTVFA